MSQPQDPSSPGSASWAATLLIADVVALTGVPAPQLRSWEQAGILHPRRSPNAVRLYSVEDVARVRLIMRSLDNPGRRGSLRRLAAQLASGTLLPEPADYNGLAIASPPAALPDSLYWQAVVDAMDDLVVVCDRDGYLTSINLALRALLEVSGDDGINPATASARYPAGTAMPAVLATLPLRWAARTGTRHRDVEVVLQGADSVEQRTVWTVTPLHDASGMQYGAVGVGRVVPFDPLPKAEDWLAAAAHDLRSPTTIILGRVQLARRAIERARVATLDKATVDRLDVHLALAEVGTVDLIRTMQTVLDAASADGGGLLQHLEPGGISLAFVVRAAIDHARAHTTRHTFTLEALDDPLFVVGDWIRLNQVLDNLLANAIKYAPEGGPITMRLETVATPPAVPPDPPGQITWARTRQDARRWVVLRLEDTGLGIPEADVPYVFDRYRRGSGAARQIPGTGLGLFTCRAIVAAHGGHIWVEKSVPATDGAEAPACHGTVMALVLPLAAPERNASDAPGTVAG